MVLYMLSPVELAIYSHIIHRIILNEQYFNLAGVILLDRIMKSSKVEKAAGAYIKLP